MLTGKQKRYLRSIAVKIKSTFQVGKDGITDNLLNSLDDYLKANELLKLNLLKTCTIKPDDFINYVCKSCKCELVQKIGKTFVFYKASKDRKIILP